MASLGPTRYYKITNCVREDTRRYVDWFERGVFDALQKRYLQVVCLEVYDAAEHSSPAQKANANATAPSIANGNTAAVGGGSSAVRSNRGDATSSKTPTCRRELLERFTFTVTYGSEGPMLGVSRSTPREAQPALHTRDRMKQSAVELLRSLVELSSTLRPLPESRVITMRVSVRMQSRVTQLLNNHPSSQTSFIHSTSANCHPRSDTKQTSIHSFFSPSDAQKVRDGFSNAIVAVHDLNTDRLRTLPGSSESHFSHFCAPRLRRNPTLRASPRSHAARCGAADVHGGHAVGI